MSVPLKWMVKDCASTLYACGLPLDEQDMIYEPPATRKKEKKIRSKNDDMKQPPIGDKEYIVFRFTQDGGIDLTEEKSLTSNWDRPMHHNHKTLKELMMFEQLSTGSGSQFKVNEDGLIISDDEGEEPTGNYESSKELSWSNENDDGDDIKVITAIEERTTEHKPLSESTRSDSSSGSFAFPVMNMEMKSSPERMPKYNEKHKLGRILQFPCCRF